MPTTFRTVGNRAVSTLNGFVFAADGTWTVTDGSVFPAGNFMVTCENEIALCTGRIGNVLTVTRAQDGTASSDHPDGSSVESRIVSSLFDNLHTAINNLEGTGIISLPSATQNLVAATTIVADALTIQISSAANIVLTANPLLADGTSDGQLLFIWNVGSFNITLNANNLQFGNVNIPPVLKPTDTLLLQWSDTLSLWLEQDSVVNNIPAARRWVISNFSPDDPPASPNTMDDEFDDSTGMSGAVNGLNARWAWRNQGAATVTYPKAGWVDLTAPASATHNWRIIEQTMPVAQDYTIEAKFSFSGGGRDGVSSARGGLILLDGVNGDFYSLGLELVMARATLEIVKWTNVTTYSGAAFDIGTANHESISGRNHLYVRLQYRTAGPTYTMYASGDGIGWHRLWKTGAGSDVITDAVVATKVGIGVSETTNEGATVHCDYFRRIA
jgi:hypothetical protein